MVLIVHSLVWVKIARSVVEATNAHWLASTYSEYSPVVVRYPAIPRLCVKYLDVLWNSNPIQEEKVREYWYCQMVVGKVVSPRVRVKGVLGWYGLEKSVVLLLRLIFWAEVEVRVLMIRRTFWVGGFEGGVVMVKERGMVEYGWIGGEDCLGRDRRRC